MHRRVKKIGLVVLLFIIGQLCLAKVFIKREMKVDSEILGRSMHYSIILPESYFDTETPFPVLYLFHGYGGDGRSWINRLDIQVLIDSLQSLHKIKELIYVFPSIGNSYGINNYDSTNQIEDYIYLEFIPSIDSTYNTIPDKDGRYIGGLSMGGFASLILSFKHPDLFATCYALSAAVRNEDVFKALPQSKYEIYFGDVYGHDLYPEERINKHWQENSPYYIIDSTNLDDVKSVYWYIDCGMDDFLFESNQIFHRYLLDLAIPHEYHARPGGHNWPYWKKSIIDIIYHISNNR